MGAPVHCAFVQPGVVGSVFRGCCIDPDKLWSVMGPRSDLQPHSGMRTRKATDSPGAEPKSQLSSPLTFGDVLCSFHLAQTYRVSRVRSHPAPDKFTGAPKAGDAFIFDC